MATMQSSAGATTFIRVTGDAANGAVTPSQLALRDGVVVRQDGGGGFTVRSSDLASLQAAGMIQSGASTQAAFAAGVVGGTGAGTTVSNPPASIYATTAPSYNSSSGFLTGTLSLQPSGGAGAVLSGSSATEAGVPMTACLAGQTSAFATGKSGGDGSWVLNCGALPANNPPIATAVTVLANYLPIANLSITK